MCIRLFSPPPSLSLSLPLPPRFYVLLTIVLLRSVGVRCSDNTRDALLIIAAGGIVLVLLHAGAVPLAAPNILQTIPAATTEWTIRCEGVMLAGTFLKRIKLFAFLFILIIYFQNMTYSTCGK